MKRSFLEAFKTSMDLGGQIDDITIKRKPTTNAKTL